MSPAKIWRPRKLEISLHAVFLDKFYDSWIIVDPSCHLLKLPLGSDEVGAVVGVKNARLAL